MFHPGGTIALPIDSKVSFRLSALFRVQMMMETALINLACPSKTNFSLSSNAAQPTLQGHTPCRSIRRTIFDCPTIYFVYARHCLYSVSAA